MEWILELCLVGLLLVVAFHAMRLERALGVLKRERAALEALVTGFDDATRAASLGIDRLRDAAEGAGRQLAQQTDTANRLKDDLVFLTSRGEALADRLEDRVRGANKAVAAVTATPRLKAVVPDEAPEAATATPQRQRSQAERDLIHALRLAR
jgi:hypothetical protein